MVLVGFLAVDPDGTAHVFTGGRPRRDNGLGWIGLDPMWVDADVVNECFAKDEQPTWLDEPVVVRIDLRVSRVRVL